MSDSNVIALRDYEKKQNKLFSEGSLQEEQSKILDYQDMLLDTESGMMDIIEYLQHKSDSPNDLEKALIKISKATKNNKMIEAFMCLQDLLTNGARDLAHKEVTGVWPNDRA